MFLLSIATSKRPKGPETQMTEVKFSTFWLFAPALFFNLERDYLEGEKLVLFPQKPTRPTNQQAGDISHLDIPEPSSNMKLAVTES